MLRRTHREQRRRHDSGRWSVAKVWRRSDADGEALNLRNFGTLQVLLASVFVDSGPSISSLPREQPVAGTRSERGPYVAPAEMGPSRSHGASGFVRVTECSESAGHLVHVLSESQPGIELGLPPYQSTRLLHGIP
jgi:hypothetical protein